MTDNNNCHNKIPFALALVTTVGFFGVQWFLLSNSFPSENRDLIMAMNGSLATIWIQQMGFFFSSSSSSKDKDRTIATAVTSNNTPSTLSTVSTTDTIVTSKTIQTPTSEGKANENPVSNPAAI